MDHSEKDEEMSSDSPTDATDSDEDFTPNKTTTTKRKLRQGRKSQTSQNENVSTCQINEVKLTETQLTKFAFQSIPFI